MTIFARYLQKARCIFEDFVVIQKELIKICDENNNSFENDDNLISFIHLLEKNSILSNQIKFKEFFHFFLHFVSYHKMSASSILNMKKLVLYLKDEVTSHISQSELFIIFQQNQQFILFLFENNFLSKEFFLQKYIYQIKSPETLAYFYPEYLSLQQEDRHQYKKIIKKLKQINYNPQEYESNIEKFIEKRRNEQNQSQIAEIIRHDLIDDFINIVSKTNQNINSEIKISYFQSDPYLLSNNNELKRPKLIDYAAYFGSIQIFKYLFLQNARITQNTWFYAIHGNNYDIIHMLETKTTEIKYSLCFYKAIYFHHNEVASYIKEQYIKENLKSLIENSFDAYNYQFIVNSFNEINENEFSQNEFESFFINLCKYGYNAAIKLLIEDSDINEVIQNIKGNIFTFMFIVFILLF